MTNEPIEETKQYSEDSQTKILKDEIDKLLQLHSQEIQELEHQSEEKVLEVEKILEGTGYSLGTSKTMGNFITGFSYAKKDIKEGKSSRFYFL